jgi:hypothetical protein
MVLFRSRGRIDLPSKYKSLAYGTHAYRDAKGALTVEIATAKRQANKAMHQNVTKSTFTDHAETPPTASPTPPSQPQHFFE